MKKLMLTLCLVLGLIIMGASMAMAATVTLNWGTYYVSPGGEFRAATSDRGTFLTFCLEYNEHFTIGQTYNYTISSAAIEGGVSGGSDPISKGTAYLFRNFVDGTFGAGYEVKSNIGAGTLQNEIWWLEDEIADPGNNIYRTLLISVFGSEDAAKLDAAPGEYGIYAMNLKTLADANAQDQLIAVPEPGILILLGIAMSAIGMASWRIRKL